MARTIVRFDPFSGAGLESLWRDLFGDGVSHGLRAAHLPTTDVYTVDDKELVVESHLPNSDERDITVDVDGGQLIIQAERRERDEDKKKNYVVRESSSSFYRSITLPQQAQQDGITAGLREGRSKSHRSLHTAHVPTPDHYRRRQVKW